MLIKARPQRFLRLKILAFLAAVSGISITGTYMFASYIDTISANQWYMTLGFHHIYVTSQRETATDGAPRRRLEMARAMQGIPFDFYPATSAQHINEPETYRYWLGEEHWIWPARNHTEASEQLADFRTHMNVINDVVRLQLGSALVLADNVGLAADVKQQMHRIIERVPQTWEILFLGHCGKNETSRVMEPPVDRLFVATSPGCTYAYAVTQQGARRLKRVLDNMWPSSPRRSFGHVLQDMVGPMYIEAYVIDPPLAVQTNV
ncbi:hypothetical protein EV175_000668 [Coemansia sp. RSA 1933]|nr:hypothetical protein EV175_000668 [Coemansia sp. RSA 1933]